MDVMWLAVLALALVSWSAVDGFTIGTGIALPSISGDYAQRRAVITAVGPYFLPGEVWLIVAAGILAGAFTGFEGVLLYGLYPVVIALLISWVIRDASMWFRNRRPAQAWTRAWDGVLRVSSIGFASAWGLLLANAAQGLPAHGETVAVMSLLDPVALLAAASMVLIFAMHGTVFTAIRATGSVAERSVRLGQTLALAAIISLALAVAVGFISGQAGGLSGTTTFLGLGLTAAGCAAAALLLGQRRPKLAFAATTIAATSPVFVAGAALSGRLTESAASPEALTRLASIAFPALAFVMVAQVILWWLFRRPVDDRSQVFF